MYPELVVLDLSKNDLKKLPKELFKLSSIEFLDLSDNLLKEIPPDIGKLRKLKYLRLDDNLLTELPPEIGDCKNLKTLNLEGNKIEWLPLELATLEGLKEEEFLYDSHYLRGDSPFIEKNFTGVLRLYEKKRSEYIRIGILELNELMDLQTAFIQYWNFFDDYVKETKGKKITFNVKKHPLGIEMEVEVSNEVSIDNSPY